MWWEGVWSTLPNQETVFRSLKAGLRWLPLLVKLLSYFLSMVLIA